jgi:hypothetical protein
MADDRTRRDESNEYGSPASGPGGAREDRAPRGADEEVRGVGDEGEDGFEDDDLDEAEEEEEDEDSL